MLSRYFCIRKDKAMKTMTLTLALMGLLAAGCTAEANTGKYNVQLS